MHMLTVILTLLWAAWVLQALVTVIQVRWFAGKLNLEHSEAAWAFRPPVSVVVPMKGIDDDISAAVANICSQDYPNYRVRFVVESEQDPAYDALREALATCGHPDTKLLIAGIAPPTQGQKVHNQLHALEELETDIREDEVWVFADSDAIPGSRWLADMVSSLSRTDVFAGSSGYRWLIPANPSVGHGPRFWSHVASVINSSVACLQGRPHTTQAWGGSMAIQARLAIKGNLRARWTGALTDDYPVKHLARALGMKIKFVPRCLQPTPVDLTFGQFWNFGHRQYLITRVYHPMLFALAAGATWLYTAAFVTSWLWCGRFAWHEPGGDRWWLPIPAMAAVFLLNQYRATLRARCIRQAFGERVYDAVRTTRLIDRWLTPWWMGMHALIVLRAMFGRTMVWRGIRYRLNAPNDVRRVSSVNNGTRADSSV